MNKISEFVQATSSEPGGVIKAINYAVAFLGVSSFLGFVHLVVGVLSAGWLALQGYGYIKYELPTKKARRDRALYMARSERDAGPSDSGELS